MRLTTAMLIVLALTWTCHCVYGQDALETMNLFLVSDTTNNNKAINNTYMCLDFSMDMIKNASLKGIDLELVHIQTTEYPDGHFVVALRTPGSMNGWTLIDPQLDSMISGELRVNDYNEVITIIKPESILRVEGKDVYFNNASSEVYKL